MPQHENQDRAERLFKAREQQKADAPQAMAEYHAAIQRTRNRTDELRRQRLAREALTQKSEAPTQKQARSR
jgi:hypothetical protein